MPLEVGTTIADLDHTWPLGGDPHNKGDDHIRLVKAILQSQFPGKLGDGYDVPIITTEQELNWLTGLTSNVQDQFDALSGRINDLEEVLNAPEGTRLVFYQAAVPNGWTQDTSKNDFMLRVVSGVGGSNGGSDSPILNNKLPLHSHEFITSAAGSHSHVTAVNTEKKYKGGGDWIESGDSYILNPKDYTSDTEPSHNHNGTTESTGDAADWTPKYVDMIIGIKD